MKLNQIMNNNFSIMIPTRERVKSLQNTLVSIFETTPDFNQIYTIHDCPDKDIPLDSVSYCSEILYPETYPIAIPVKSSLTQLWNYCVMFCPTDWVLIVADDTKFLPGWQEYLEEKIAQKYLQIHLCHYSAFCLHKSLILQIGWFDENFRGGYFEDNDWSLRITEAKLKNRVDWSNDGKFVHHVRAGEHKWIVENNQKYIEAKWGRSSMWTEPSCRLLPEQDWHPAFTCQYQEKFKIKSQISTIQPNSTPVFQ